MITTIISIVIFGIVLAFVVGYAKSTKEGKIQMPVETKTVKKTKKTVKKAVTTKTKKTAKKTK